MREMVRISIMKMVEIGGGARFLRARVAPQRPSNVELITVSLSRRAKQARLAGSGGEKRGARGYMYILVRVCALESS